MRRAAVVLTAGLAVWATAATAQTALDQARLIDQAIDAGRLVQAQTMLDIWRIEDPKAGGVALSTARLALVQHRDEEATAQFTALDNAGSKDCRVSEGLGIGMVRLGLNDEAVAPLRRAVAACPSRWQAWNALGIAEDALGDWVESGKAYEAAFKLTDRPAAVANNYGFSLLRQGQPVQAARLFDRARTLDPTNDRYLNNDDVARVLAGQPLVPVKGEGEGSDGWARRLANAGRALMATGQPGEAQAYLSRAVREGSSLNRQADADLAGMRPVKR